MEDLVFSVDSALLSELGEKLVASVHVALVELVRNSYDADATQVTVKVIPSNTGGPEIHVIDNGSGMTFADTVKYWMRIATTNKVNNNTSPSYGRLKTGAKGIGRFCCRRLGNDLKLITISKTKDGKFERTEVEFLWDQFVPGTEVADIVCHGKKEFIQKANTGTTLIIKGSSKDEWGERSYGYLERQFVQLVANRGIRRDGYEEDPGFNIVLDAPGHDSGKLKDIRAELISAGWGTLTARVNNYGVAVCSLDAKDIGKVSITIAEKYPHLSGVSLEIGIIPEKKEQLRKPNLLSKYILSKVLPDWGGVQIRYNGFRVYPYGDDDWLGIDKDRGYRKSAAKDELFSLAASLRGVDPKKALLSLLSMTSHVGSVSIDSTVAAKNFDIKINREGLVENQAFNELRRFVRYTIDWATIYRDYYLRTETKQNSEVAREYLEKALNVKIDEENVVPSAVKYIRREIKNVSSALPASEKLKIEKSFINATDAILRHDESNKQELYHLRLVASTSTLLLIFSHEVKSLLGLLSQSADCLHESIKILSKNDASIVNEIRGSLLETKKRFSELLDMTSVISTDSKAATVTHLALKDRVHKAIKCFALIMSKYDIKIEYEQIPNNVVVGPILEAELYAIILNILSNSIKSVIATGKKGKIEISAKRENSRTIINIYDTGLGIDEDHYDDVFIPFVSDPSGKLYESLKKNLNPEDKYIVGTGSGLGLSIVKEIVQIRKGNIRFVKPQNEWKAILEVVLP